MHSALIITLMYKYAWIRHPFIIMTLYRALTTILEWGSIIILCRANLIDFIPHNHNGYFDPMIITVIIISIRMFVVVECMA